MHSLRQSPTIFGNQQLAEYPFPRALADLAQDNASGSLRVRRGKLERNILISNGAPVHVESNIVDDSLERFMVKRGELDQTVAFQAASEAAASNRLVGEILVQKGAIGPSDMFKRMKLCMGATILATFGWVDGELLFEKRPPATEGMILLKIRPGPLVVRGVCTYSPFDLINKEFLKFKCDRFKLVGPLEQAITQLQLDPTQSRIAHALTESAGPNRVAMEADADMELVLRVLYALVLLGVAGPAEEVEHNAASATAPPASAEEAAPAGASDPLSDERLLDEQLAEADAPAALAEPEDPAPEPTPAERAATPLTPEEQDQIERTLCVARSKTYYELLEVAPDVRFGQLRRKFLAKCHALSPMSFAGRDLGSHQDQLEELFLALVRAFSTLSVAGHRQAYDEKLKQAQKTTRRASVTGKAAGEDRPPKPRIRETTIRYGDKPQKTSPPPKSKNAFYVQEPKRASVTAKTAIAFLNVSQPAAAAASLIEAMKDDPKDALAIALLGYSLYLTDPYCNGAKATKYLRRAIKQDNEAILPKVLLGRVLELEKEPTEALACYEACLAIDPGHAEAAQAVCRLRPR